MTLIRRILHRRAFRKWKMRVYPTQAEATAMSATLNPVLLCISMQRFNGVSQRRLGKLIAAIQAEKGTGR